MGRRSMRWSAFNALTCAVIRRWGSPNTGDALPSRLRASACGSSRRPNRRQLRRKTRPVPPFPGHAGWLRGVKHVVPVIRRAVACPAGCASARSWSWNFSGKSPGVSRLCRIPSSASRSSCRPSGSSRVVRRKRVDQQVPAAALAACAMQHRSKHARIRG